MKTPCLALQLVAATLVAAAGSAHADAFYSSAGLPGATVGYAKSLSSSITLRADLTSAPGIPRDAIVEGVSYSGHIKSDRGAAFMDWYFAANLRLTGGMTFNRTRVDLRASASGGTPLIGDIPYSTAVNDRFDVAIRSPNTLPYLGVGYGQYNSSGSSFLFDIGGSFGRPSLNEGPSGPSLGNVSQAALDSELAQLREGIGRVRFVPQVSLGMTLKF